MYLQKSNRKISMKDYSPMIRCFSLKNVSFFIMLTHGIMPFGFTHLFNGKTVQACYLQSFD